MEIVKETHARTVAKTISYRVLVMIAIVAIAYFIFNDSALAGGVGLMALLVGTITYYLHDRVWLFIPWNRDNEGKDGVKRSTVKTFTYRVLIMIAAALTLKIATGGQATNEQIASFLIIQAVVNVAIYFSVERVFNIIAWGKIKDEKLETPIPTTQENNNEVNKNG